MKIRQLSHSLGAQLVALMAGILLLAMGTNVYLQYRDEMAMVDRILETRAKSLGEMLAAMSVEAILLYDVVTLNDHVEHATRQAHVVYAAFLDPDGKPLTTHLDLENPMIQQAMHQAGSRDPAAVANALAHMPALHSHQVPVSFNDQFLGRVLVSLDRSAYTAASSAKLKRKMLATLLIGLGVGFGIYLVIRRKLLHPVQRLAAGAQHISRGEFDHRVATRGNNELARLAQVFNHMAERLQSLMADRDQAVLELARSNQSLEERVHERTLELQSLNAAIAHQAMHDPLTELPNRSLLLERLQQAIRLGKRNNTRLAFLMLDLNNFKEVNDTLGHPEGDRLLREVANRLPAALRESDTVGRLGGDEFGIVLPEVEIDQAWQVAAKIISTLAPCFSLEGQVISISASIGIALYPDHGEEHTALIRHADVAMYESKHREGKPCVYDPEFDHYTTRRLALMADLHQAIHKNELELHYQPQVDLRRNRVVAVEALLRWKHPREGIISPELFIPMAETSNLIKLLSDWVLKTAILQLQEWQSQGIDLQVSLNLSARDLLDPELPQHIGMLCSEHRVNATSLKIEITENVIMSNPDKMMAVVEHPLMSTLHYAIDDFGTGYSSLSYLKKLPVDEVKIDKSFVLDMDQNEEDASIVHSVIDLAHNLGHYVVAEGVENQRTLEMLVELGCDLAQGFYFSPAVPAGQLPAIIERIEIGLCTGPLIRRVLE